MSSDTPTTMTTRQFPMRSEVYMCAFNQGHASALNAGFKYMHGWVGGVFNASTMEYICEYEDLIDDRTEAEAQR